MKTKSLAAEVRKGDWILRIDPVPWSDMVRVWLVCKTPKGAANSAIKDGRLELTEVEGGLDNPLPLMEIPSQIWEAFAEATQETVEPIKQEIVDAELKATKYHLEDFRSLIFKKK